MEIAGLLIQPAVLLAAFVFFWHGSTLVPDVLER